MTKKIKPIVFIIIAGIIGVMLASYLWQNGRNHNTIKVSGNIETTQVRLSFRIPGKIKELLTDEGMRVEPGGVVARLDTDELEKIKAEIEASLKAAEFTYQLAQQDYQRLEELFKAGAVSAQKRDTAKTNADSAGAQVAALKASLQLAETRLGFTELVSPLDSFVLTKSAEKSEVVQAGQTVFTIADLSDIWLTAYINETDLAKVKLNQEVQIRVDSYPAKIYNGRISFISQEAEFTPKQIQTTEERTRLVYRIKIKVDNTGLELKPGMPADGYIKIK